MLTRSSKRALTAAAADDLAARAKKLPEVAGVRADLERDGGRARLVQVSLRVNPNDASEHVDSLVEQIEAVRSRILAFASRPPGLAPPTRRSATWSRTACAPPSCSRSLVVLLGLASFRSLPLALAVIGLNLLSVGAAHGVLTAVFQNTWAESWLDFTSSGTIADWVPLNTFVILFGLSMDYTILVLERVREARRSGRTPREAAAEGVGATAGAITSAAIFPTLPLIEMKMIGVALAAGVLIDATLVRGITLPAPSPSWVNEG